MELRSSYKLLADLLEYPVEDWRFRRDEPFALPQAANESLLCDFALFVSETEHLSISDLQELYTRTFDLSPVCALEIGYHLFGENYKRGVFLANLRETEAPLELGQNNQLPDYLPVLLRLLTKLNEEELRHALIVDCMIPALEKMLKTLSEGENPYRHLIATVRTALKAEAGAYPAIIRRAHLPVIQGSTPHEIRPGNTDLLRC